MNIRENFVRAYRSGELLETVRAALTPDKGERAALASELAALHNEALIDLIGEYCASTGSTSDQDFFLLRRFFGELLPKLEVPMCQLVRCVVHLNRDAAAGMVLNAFQEYCAADPQRPEAALVEIEADPDNLAGLLALVLVGGARIAPDRYFSAAVRLSRDNNLELRRRALFALGQLAKENVSCAGEDTAMCLEHAVSTEDDDQVMANVVKSSFALVGQGSVSEARAVAVIAIALSKGGEITLHAASDLFGFETPESSPELLELLVEHLGLVDSLTRGMLDNIDYGIARLLESEQVDVGLEFLERLLRRHPGGSELAQLDDAVRAIRENPELRSRAVTRWLVSGEVVLGESVDAVVEAPMGGALVVEVDIGELPDVRSSTLIFVARKALGYLFLKPLTVTSFLLSLLRQAPEPGPQRELQALLLNPLLLNFSGAVGEYLEERLESETGEVKVAVRRALEALEAYVDTLKSVGEIPALRPRLEHREAHHRHWAEEVAQSFRKAQAQSPFLQLMHRSVLLYGHKAIHHAFGPEGQIRRMETQIGGHSAEIEIPRMAILDPQGLDYMIRVFRHEKISP